MTTAPLSPSVAMPVLNDKPPPTPAKPALAVERLAAPESDRLRANATFNCYIAAQGNFSTASIHSDRSASSQPVSCTNEAVLPTYRTVMHLQLLEPSNCHRNF